MNLQTYMRARNYAPGTIELYSRAISGLPLGDNDAVAEELARRQTERGFWARQTYQAVRLAQAAAGLPSIADVLGAPLRRPSAPRAHARAQMRAAIAAPSRERDRLMLTIAYACALRVGEVVALTVADVTAAPERCHIAAAKTGAHQTVYITAALQARALRYARAQGLGPAARLFAFSPREARRIWQRAQAAAGLEALTFHSLRHAAAIHMLEAGYTLEDVRRHLRHASLSSTQVYLQAAPALGLK